MRSAIRAALALALLFPFAASAFAEDLTLSRDDAPIESATVYARQALVKRVAAFDAKGGGPLTVTIARLPALVHDDSVRVRAEAGLTLLGSRVVAKPVTASTAGEAETLTADLAALDAKRRVLLDAKEVANATIKHVEAIQATHASEAATLAAADPSSLEKVVTWCAKVLKFQLEQRRDADAEIAKIDAKRSELEAKIRELKQAQGYEKDLEVELDAKAGGRFRIEVEYVTEGASWEPAYDFRADADAKAIDVTYFGEVTQRTGEDWKGVKLALSTARPELGARPPELPPYVVTMRPRYEANAAPTSEAAAPAAQAAPDDVIAKFGGTDVGVARGFTGEVQTASPERRGATVAFQIPSPETIPSDGKTKRTTIGKQTFKTDNRYFTAPKASPFAYLRATVANAFLYPMLAGDANVFFGPDFVGRAKVDLVAPGDKFDIYLGVDERLRVERRIDKRFRDTKGVFTSDVRLRTEYTLLVKNNRDAPVQVTVVDQVPISQNEDVKIEDVKFSIDPTEKNDTTGERRWSVGIAAKGGTEIGIGFTVRFPEKEEHDVLGLER